MASITILNWDKFNPRKDVKNPSWFRLDHGLFENPDFYDFSHTEICVLIYLLSIASKRNSGTFQLNYQHVERIGRFKIKEFDVAVKKLEALQVLLVDVTRTSRARHAHVTDTNATNEQDEHNGQIITPELQKRKRETDNLDHPLVKIWNANRGDLPKVKGCKGKRLTKAEALWSEKPETEYWSEIVCRMAKSDFCLGKKNQPGPHENWKADFDFFVQPETHIKVSEGKYDNRQSSSSGVVFEFKNPLLDLMPVTKDGVAK